MIKRLFPLVITLGLALFQNAYAADVSEQLLQGYRADGAGPFSAEAGQAMWSQSFTAKSGAAARSCKVCHGTDLLASGKHKRTGKAIKPLAPSVNPERLSDAKKVEKWFKRNCKWTTGRLCTAQEKGDLLLFIKSQ